LASLIFEWLLIEKERDNFSVESVEKEMTLNLQNIQFRFRLDRVDSNDQGKLEIIDYKTGKVQVNDWFSVRPTEAQMPAYMLTFTDDDISAIDYARIKKGEVAQVGLSFNDSSNKAELNDDERIIKFENYIDESNAIESKYTKLKEKSLSATNRFDREELKLQWQQTLDRIAYGMSQGFAPVSPKDINRSCTYCEYRSVCRIDERQPDLNNCELPIENKNKSIDLAQELEL
jgi:ATP-dependent helicase/nuclease subunit B